MEVHPFSFGPALQEVSVLPKVDSPSTLVLIFADPSLEQADTLWAALRDAFPQSVVLGCSTAGNISSNEIRDDSVEGVAVRFDRTSLHFASVQVFERDHSFQAGRTLAEQLPQAGLRSVLLLSDGLTVNGSELVRGLTDHLPQDVSVSGGLAADGSRFGRTWLITQGLGGSNQVAAVGLYGDHIQVRHGTEGGWDKFGISRKVTRAVGPVVYEMDGRPALALYKEYLGECSSGLPATGLLFPLAIRSSRDEQHSVVRTILQVDEAEQSLIFAGDVPVNSYAQLMKANGDRLIRGAALAGEQAAAQMATASLHSLALVVSCVGRRLVLNQRAEEELEALGNELPSGTHQIGFYSYGEIAPSPLHQVSCLHNQTMTVTLIHET